MGLGAPKQRNKLSGDPNNTSWSTQGCNYGQKILSAQGWKPGDYLGAQDANHSGHYTAANASHIKVLLREENLGLGAQIGKGNAETFGLNLFSGVLGRLNGKSDVEVEKQQVALRDAELRTYHANKHGFLNFVRGGLLVGDKIEPFERQGSAGSRHIQGHSDNPVNVRSRAKKDQAKVEGLDEDECAKKNGKPKASRNEKVDRSPRRKASKLREPDPTSESATKYLTTPSEDLTQSSDMSDPLTDDRDVKRQKKRSKRNRISDDPSELLEDDLEIDRQRRRAERRTGKEDRRRRKEERRRLKSSSEEAGQTNATSSRSNGDSSIVPSSNRHAVRRRYIDSKRMASMNPQSMKEIFMLQAPA